MKRGGGESHQTGEVIPLKVVAVNDRFNDRVRVAPGTNNAAPGFGSPGSRNVLAGIGVGLALASGVCAGPANRL